MRRNQYGQPLGLSRSQSNQHFRNDGRPKLAFATKEEAVAMLIERGGAGLGHTVAPYRCGYCAYIHLGQPPATRRTVYDPAMDLELGDRACAHLYGESAGPEHRRLRHIARNCAGATRLARMKGNQ